MAISLPLDATEVLGRREPSAAQQRQVQTRRRATLASWADTAYSMRDQGSLARTGQNQAHLATDHILSVLLRLRCDAGYRG